jgi:probable HAF family extracellular repeat protein
MHDLGTFGTVNSRAVGVNNRGEALVWSTPPEDLFRTAIVNVRTGKVRVLAALDQVFTPADINDRGQLIGDVYTPGGGHAVLVQPNGGSLIDLGTLGGPISLALGLNERGQVVGLATLQSIDAHPFLWDPRSRRLEDLGTLGGSIGVASDINERGQVVGSAQRSDGHSHAFLWDPGSRRMRDLGTLGGAFSRATGINNRGEVVGESETATGVRHAFLWQPTTGRMSDLGSLSQRPDQDYSEATDINERGQVVGTSFLDSGPSRGFVWDAPTGRMIDLGSLGGGSSQADDMNNSGDVIGAATTPDLANHAFSVRVGMNVARCG